MSSKLTNHEIVHLFDVPLGSENEPKSDVEYHELGLWKDNDNLLDKPDLRKFEDLLNETFGTDDTILEEQVRFLNETNLPHEVPNNSSKGILLPSTSISNVIPPSVDSSNQSIAPYVSMCTKYKYYLSSFS